jgi:hypothetical protein
MEPTGPTAARSAAPPWPGSEPSRTRTIWVRPPRDAASRAAWSARIESGRFARVYAGGDEARAWAEDLTRRVRGLSIDPLTDAPAPFPWKRIHGDFPRAEVLVIADAETLTAFLTDALGGGDGSAEVALDPGRFAIVDIDGRGIALRAANWPETLWAP